MRVLLAGGAGYIGAHTALALIEHGHEVLIVDDFSNSCAESIRRVEALSGTSITVIENDLSNLEASRVALNGHTFDAVIHLAGLKAVGESTEQPIRYYRTNLDTTLNLLEIMRERSVTQLVFSSSATVYGTPQVLPLSEDHPVGNNITNPYGWSKAMNEQIIRDVQAAWPELGAVLLRYFNPVGAHPSGQIGEDPSGPPSNLMPYVTQVAIGRRERLAVFGDGYETNDGTGVRDYIHVMDLAEGHVAALEHLRAGTAAYNLGTGRGSSVLELVRAFEQAVGLDIPYEIVAARAGDVAEAVADPSLAHAELGWTATRSLDDACRDSWAWQSANPNGYGA